jgi:alpha-beta hydrolase superfamily lysophospholipase
VRSEISYKLTKAPLHSRYIVEALGVVEEVSAMAVLYYLTFLSFVLLNQAAWNRPNDESLSTVNPQSFSCGPACQKLIAAGIQADRTEVYGHIPFDEDFYSTSPGFSASTSKPGDLLKVQAYIHTAPTSAWQLPGGTTLFRIQYVSVSADEAIVPATAFVAFPFARPRYGEPYKMVAFAHGTIGTTYGCAPSTAFNLYDYDTVSPLLLAGYAVVGADYAGLGNNYTKAYWEANTLNAYDVVYSAVAAKKAWPKLLTKEWVAIGHSQGGGTAWGVAESNALDGCGLELLGSVPLEPGARFADEVAYAIEASSQASAPATALEALAAYTGFVYAAVDAFNPSVVEDIFTPVMVERFKLGEELGMCFYLEASLVGDVVTVEGLSGVIKNFTLLDETLQNYQAVTGAGTGRKAKVPMLVVQSIADETVPFPVVAKAVQATCGAGGAAVEFSVYSALDHSAAASASAPEWLRWIGDRFAGVPALKKCKVSHRRAMDVSAAYLPKDF